MLLNFLVIGAEKCGTTWVHQALRAHPEIYLPATKEIHFFNRLDSNLREVDGFRRGLDWYERFFRDWKGETRVGEVTPLYICDDLAPWRIAETLPDVRIVCILRHPVDRAYSHYWMARLKGHEARSFAELAQARDVRFIDRGLYGRQLTRVFDLFGRDHVAVLIFEEMMAAPDAGLRGLADWLGVSPHGFPDSASLVEENRSARFAFPALLRQGPQIARLMQGHPWGFRIQAGLKKSGLTDWIKRRNRVSWQYPELGASSWLELANYYHADLGLLEDLLGRTVASWRKLEETRCRDAQA